MCSLEGEGCPRHQAVHRAGPQIGIGLNKLQLGCAPNVPLAQHPRLPHHSHVLARLDLQVCKGQAMIDHAASRTDLMIAISRLVLSDDSGAARTATAGQACSKADGYGWHAATETPCGFIAEHHLSTQPHLLVHTEGHRHLARLLGHDDGPTRTPAGGGGGEAAGREPRAAQRCGDLLRLHVCAASCGGSPGSAGCADDLAGQQASRDGAETWWMGSAQ